MRLIHADAALIAKYNSQHEREQDKAGKLIEDAPTVNGWISVKDRLPEMYKAVLGYAPYHNNVWAVTMRENGEWYIWSPVSRRYDPDFEGPITHWMPMPEPPEKEK